ncbi:MAG: acyl-CoA thioester hydrolase/BAAT C-terminal domain-containing protein [Halobacteriota archaeon]
MNDRHSISSPTIDVSDSSPLFDEPIAIRIGGCPPDSRLAVTTRMPMPDGTYRSSIEYRSDAGGVVDLRTAIPLDDTADRPVPMAPFWAMSRTTDRPRVDRRTLVRRVDVELSVSIAGQVCARRSIERRLTTERASREAIDGTTIGEQWYPARTEPAPGVVLLGGSEGGLPPRLPAGLLAARGYAVLAPAYFGRDGLPPTLEGIDLEYFDRAIDRFCASDRVLNGPMAVMGWSRGGELALELASRDPRITTAIAWSPSHVRFDGVPDGFRRPDPAWLDNGVPLPSVPLSPSIGFLSRLCGRFLARRPFELAPLYARALDAASEERISEATIDLGAIDGPTLLLSGGDDELWPADRLAAAASERADLTHRTYRDAGHAIGVPYRPLAESTTGPPIIPGLPSALGGTPTANARASVDAWNAALDTLVAGLR